MISSNTSADIRQIPLTQAKEIWDKLLTADAVLPIFSFGWYNAWISTNPAWEPYILLVNDQTIAPFVKQGSLVQFTHVSTDFNDLIGIKEHVWPVILSYLKLDGVKKMEIENIIETSETVTFFNEYSSATMHVEKPAPFIPLPDSFETYLSSLREKRKKYRKFSRDFPNAQISFSQDPEKDLSYLLELMEKSSHKQSSLTQEKKAFFHSIITTCRENTRLMLITLDNNVIGAQLMFIHNKMEMVYISGFDKNTYPNIGTYMLISAIKQAIEDKYTMFSLLKGKEPYKYELGAQDTYLYKIVVEFN